MLVPLVCVSSVVIGDCIGYAVGYYLRIPAVNRLGKSVPWARAERFFQRWGGLSVFLTRFLITGIASPVNIIAGMGNISFRTFLFYDVSGEAIWVFGYGGLGYIFGSQWEMVSEFMNNFGTLILGLAIFGAGVWLARKRMKAAGKRDTDSKVPEL